MIRHTMRSVGLTLTLIAAICGVSAAQQTDETDELELAPERAAAQVAPAELAIAGLPPLVELQFDPQVAEVTVPQVALPALDIAAPEISLGPAGSTTEVGDQLFVEARVAGTSVNSIVGAVSVARFGEGPGFRLDFEHASQDGFGFRSPGTGFFRNTNLLEAQVELGGQGRNQLDTQLRYNDLGFGLQGLSPFFSAEVRQLAAGVVYRRAFEPGAALVLDGAAQDDRRVLTESEVDGSSAIESYRRFDTSAALEFQWPTLRFAPRVSAQLLDAADIDIASRGSIAAGVLLDWAARPGFTFLLETDALYDPEDGLFFPARAAATLQPTELLRFGLGGGFEAPGATPATFWADNYLLAQIDPTAPDRLPRARRYFADLGVGIDLADLSIDLGVAWSSQTDGLLLGDFTAASSTYQLTEGDLERLDGEAVVAFDVGTLDVALAWNTAWLDRLPGEPEQTLSGSIAAGFDPMTAVLDVEHALFDSGGVPLLSLEIGGEIGAGLSVAIFGRDLLAPLTDDERGLRLSGASSQDPFVDTGLIAGAELRLRL